MTSGDGRQALIVLLPATLSRRLRVYLDTPSAPYSDLSEFLQVAAENQLALEQAGLTPRSAVNPPPKSQLRADHSAEGELRRIDRPHREEWERWLVPPNGTTVAIASAAPKATALFALTNRLNPIPLACRV